MARSTELVELYVDAEDRHRWRYVAANGAVLADSAQGYASRTDALRSAGRVCGFGPRGDVYYHPDTRELYGYIERPDRWRDLEVVSR